MPRNARDFNDVYPSLIHDEITFSKDDDARRSSVVSEPAATPCHAPPPSNNPAIASSIPCIFSRIPATSLSLSAALLFASRS